jgi:hypothetical protein
MVDFGPPGRARALLRAATTAKPRTRFQSRLSCFDKAFLVSTI